MKKSIAFTLAETLMVIGIIGVVSALTLPNLNSNTKDIEYVSMLKKTSAEIQNALDLAKDKYGDYDSWFSSSATFAQNSTVLGERLSEYLLLSKNCKLQTNQWCSLSTNATSITGSTINNSNYDANSNIYKFLLKGGTSVSCEQGWIILDLDGPNKGPNTMGRDVFSIELSDGNLVFYQRNILTAANVTACRSGSHGICASWVMEFDNNDYARCTGLSYDGNTTCK